jgi:hypoxanthine-DNA glycosylase
MGQARKVTPSSVKKKRASSMFFAKKVDLKEEIEAEKGDTPQKDAITRTQSFKPLWHGTLHSRTNVKVHTLILGTHPSVTSLGKGQYYAHPMNAFWWIAGDCLGFRRASGISPSSGEPYKLAHHLMYGDDKIIPYEEQVEMMASNGFAMWDILGSCERKGSLDVDIKKEQPNDIREFCRDHPTIKRIILANGMKQCTFFNKYFEDWWLSGHLKPGSNDLSKVFDKKWSKKTDGFKHGKIEIVCMPGVSPAAASIPYHVKRDAFRDMCYNPGLFDHALLNQS